MSLQPTDLPDTLRERTRVLRGDGLDGDFVLYWVRGAIRGWENPALDVAIEAANRLGKPLFVHQIFKPDLITQQSGQLILEPLNADSWTINTYRASQNWRFSATAVRMQLLLYLALVPLYNLS